MDISLWPYYLFHENPYWIPVLIGTLIAVWLRNLVLFAAVVTFSVLSSVILGGVWIALSYIQYEGRPDADGIGYIVLLYVPLLTSAALVVGGLLLPGALREKHRSFKFVWALAFGVGLACTASLAWALGTYFFLLGARDTAVEMFAKELLSPLGLLAGISGLLSAIMVLALANLTHQRRSI